MSDDQTRTVLQKTGYHTSVNTTSEVFAFVMEKLEFLETSGAKMSMLNVEGRICLGHEEDGVVHQEPHDFYEVTLEGITEVEEPKPNSWAG